MSETEHGERTTPTRRRATSSSSEDIATGIRGYLIGLALAACSPPRPSPSPAPLVWAPACRSR